VPLWWPLTKGHLALHKKMRPTFLSLRIALFHDAEQANEKVKGK